MKIGKFRSDDSLYPVEIEISFSQISLFHPNLSYPFNDWTETHVHQGFSWRPESVSFATLNESGKATIYIKTLKALQLRPDTIRAIRVPFTVPEGDLLV